MQRFYSYINRRSFFGFRKEDDQPNQDDSSNQEEQKYVNYGLRYESLF